MIVTKTFQTLLRFVAAGYAAMSKEESESVTPMFDGQPKEIIFYQTADGARPCEEWLEDLRDRQAEARIQKRLIRLRAGNPGDFKTVGSGVYELRIDYGPGYRVYFAFAEQQLVLLLCGGDKSTQAADIEAAQKYWKDFKERAE